MAKRRPQRPNSDKPRPAGGKPRGKKPGVDPRLDAPMRIIGGQLKHKKILYSGDERTRPMKERVREAVFNLIGPRIEGMHAIDLFAGTGALGMEALSRGACHATFIERHIPTSKLIRDNAELLEVTDKVTIHPQNSFFWTKGIGGLKPEPWVVFFCPPYELFESMRGEMVSQITRVQQHAPVGSVLVVEFDQRFDPTQLPQAERWDVRPYPPAIVAIFRQDEPLAADEPSEA
ncbi:MAG: RsmD family RNA methyltransferase [Pirellulaceae bacterium]